MITGTYNLAVNPQWKNLQLSEVFLECDTTLAPVTINLFEIGKLLRFWNVKIIISDVNNNAGTNNITINAGGSDTMDDSSTVQIVLNGNGESVALQVASETQWLASESVAGGGGTPIWDLVAGDPLLGADIRVESGFSEISETVIYQTKNHKVFKLKGRVDFDGTTNIYANYIGLITVDAGLSVDVVANESIFVCEDGGIAGTVVSPLAVNGYVQNTITGNAENIPFVWLNPDNTIGNPNEFYFFLLTGNPNNFLATAWLDITLITTSANVTYTQNL